MAAKSTKYITIGGTAFLILFLYYLISNGCLTNPDQLELLIKSFGILAPIFFLTLQIIQVIIPIIPGGITAGIGVILFGPFWGFVLNYAGSMMGSIIAFMMVKRYGHDFILKFTDQKTYDKYIGWLDQGKKFDRFFSFAILVPGFPDDLLCMIAGLTSMSLKKFIFIIATCKPLALIAYSWGIKEIIMRIGTMF